MSVCVDDFQSSTALLQKSPSEEFDEDERMRDLPIILDVLREEVPIRRREAAAAAIVTPSDEVAGENADAQAAAAAAQDEVVYYEVRRMSCSRYF